MRDSVEHDEDVNLRALAALDEELDTVMPSDCSDNDYHAARRALTQHILGRLREEQMLSLPDAVDLATRSTDVSTRREIALLIVHAASKPRVLPASDGANQLDRKIVALIEKGIPDIARKFGLNDLSQNFQKMRRISEIHAEVCEPIEFLKRLSPDSRVLLAGRQAIIKAIGSERISAYFAPYDQKRIKSALIHAFSEFDDLMKVTDASFGSKITDLKEFIAHESSWCELYPTHLNSQYYRPTLAVLAQSVQSVADDSFGRFSSYLKAKRTGNDIAEKHYPLHEVGRVINASVMLTCSGPGVAMDVQLELQTAKETVQFDPRIAIGNISPGDYPLTFSLMAEESCATVQFQATLSWVEVGQSVRKTTAFNICLYGQNPAVDWDRLKHSQPYSIEVAEGDEFVGRVSKVRSLSSRLLQDRMGSSFITGQKRVGKTSLARAVEGTLVATGPEYRVSYVEYGQYSRMGPVETVAALGSELADAFISEHEDLAKGMVLDFNGTIAPINKLADLLYKVCPTKRMIFILDEFDEIHPEMYRYGPLAEAFFSNLRTLSAKKNVAFLLVGGEKMPFVMSAQGDQLNKFVSERLDSFSKTDGWADYVELVQKPVRGSLQWSDDAIQAVYMCTNGHPYYTKLLCAKVFSNSVLERDAEITESDVRHANNLLISELDSNSFAHLWKDGISEDRELTEVLELNRRRFLSACARTLRAGKPLDIGSVSSNKSGLRITDAEITPIFNDFVRRRILILNSDQLNYCFSIPLFEGWLREAGMSLLMTDSLAEEYETADQKAEELARINSAELVELADNWDPYRGRQITTDAIRAWIEQVPRHQDQRLLFKLLRSLRFVSKLEIRSALRDAHSTLHEHLPAFIQETRSDRRKDIIVTFVDGVGKSGATYAALYAEENRLSARSVISPDALSSTLTDYEVSFGTSISALVLVDDVIGSGRSLSANLKSFIAEHGDFLRERRIAVLVVALTATPRGEHKVREELANFGIEADLKVIEPIGARLSAFSDGLGIWSSAEERGRAKELCERLGAKVHKTNVLGYDDQGLLLVFPETCPNNSLPILHGRGSGIDAWKPLFPRL